MRISTVGVVDTTVKRGVESSASLSERTTKIRIVRVETLQKIGLNNRIEREVNSELVCLAQNKLPIQL